MSKRITGRVAAAAVAAVSALLLSSGAAGAAAVHVENGRFLQTNWGVPPAGYQSVVAGNSFIHHWTVGDGGVDVLGDRFGNTPSNSRAVDLNGPGGMGSVSTEFEVEPGSVVQVHFMATSASTNSVPGCWNSPESRFSVRVNDAGEKLFNVGRPDGQTDWQRLTYTYRVGQPDSTLSFTSLTGGTVCGAWITNVWAEEL